MYIKEKVVYSLPEKSYLIANLLARLKPSKLNNQLLNIIL